MIGLLEPILAQVKTEYIIIFVGIMVICAILAIIKKAFKVGVIVVVLGLFVGMLAPMAKDFQKNYSFNIENGTAMIKIQGQEFEIDKDEVKSFVLENKNGKEYTLAVSFTDGSNLGIRVPTFMRDSLVEFAEHYHINHEIKD